MRRGSRRTALFAKGLYLAALVPVDGVNEPWLAGSIRRGLIGSWLISTPDSTPAVQLPVGMIVSVSC
jgi:hypothetical protein